jgi:hypothetical protein
MTAGYSGGCQCGRLRFHAEAPLGKADFCHCRMCQKAFGAAGAALVSVPLAQFTWTRGAPATFRSSAIVDRGFCPACGTPLSMFEDGDDHIELAVGAFDEADRVGPFRSQIGIESRVSWFNTLHVLPEARTEEQRTPEDLRKLRSLQHSDHDTESWPPRSR